jgi:hypothetical protein
MICLEIILKYILNFNSSIIWNIVVLLFLFWSKLYDSIVRHVYLWKLKYFWKTEVKNKT